MLKFTYLDYCKYNQINAQNQLIKLEEANEEYNYHIVNNAHDKIFRDLLMDKEEVANLLNKILKLTNKLTQDTIEKYNTNFITYNYKNRQSDIVYKIKDNSIFFLIEHQSKIDYSMPYRILNYSMEIMRDLVEGKNIKVSKYKYPIIIPIVIYTGNYRWRVSRKMIDISKKFEGHEKESITVEYNLMDINNYSKENLVNSKLFIPKIMAIEKCKTREELIEVLEKIILNINRAKDKQKIERIIKYILVETLGNEEIQRLISKLNKEEEEVSMLKENLLKEKKMIMKKAAKEGLKQGMEKGMRQGMRQGMQKGIQDSMIKIIKNMTIYGETEEKIQKYTGMTNEQIKNLKAEMNI